MNNFGLGPAILFVPADRPDRYAKAYERADSVIIDLEDAVDPQHRADARAALRQHLSTMDGQIAQHTIVRCNPVGTEDFAQDIIAIRGTALQYVMIPKTQGIKDIQHANKALPGVWLIALCETTQGVLNAAHIAQQPAVAALMWGAEDLMVSLGGTTSRHPNGQYRDVARYARAQVLLAASAAGKASIDTIHTDLSPTKAFLAEAQDSAVTGWDAKACIHPAQVATVRNAYLPSDEAVDDARQLLAQAEQHCGVFRFQGRMVDGPLIEHARTVVARSQHRPTQ